ncbi:hypothetical protein L1049_014468 [Liquidambar formosana]|uniref:Uncharacterized protein n=1 Tax=Liquidambar formosana TaxID=63359 RepID=A0AAP0X5F8_LIQFO
MLPRNKTLVKMWSCHWRALMTGVLCLLMRKNKTLVKLSNSPIDDHGLVETAVSETAADANIDGNANGVHGNNETDGSNVDQLESGMPHERSSNTKSNHDEKGDEYNDGVSGMELCSDRGIKEEVSNPKLDEIKVEETKPKLDEIKDELSKPELDVVKKELSKPGLGVGRVVNTKSPNQSFLSEPLAVDGDESGTEEEQAAFMKELETFFKESSLEFKPPKFYGEGLNLLKLWRAVTRLGGYEQVTSCKLWRQVGESFKPPKTCTTVSWTFRCFYEKALLEYEKHKMRGGELPLPDASLTEPISIGHQAGGNQASGSGRARRDAAARAMQGWHSQRLLGNGEVGDPIIKDKNSSSTPKREKHLKSIGLLKRKRPSSVERAVKVARMKATKPQLDTMVVDVGPPADWVKINVRKTKDCFEVYALVPGLLREEVRVQSDPAGRLVISGEPEQLDNPWGVTPFKKVVSLPSRIDPHQTSAVVTLHGQLFVRVPFEQSDL